MPAPLWTWVGFGGIIKFGLSLRSKQSKSVNKCIASGTVISLFEVSINCFSEPHLKRQITRIMKIPINNNNNNNFPVPA